MTHNVIPLYPNFPDTAGFVFVCQADDPAEDGGILITGDADLAMGFYDDRGGSVRLMLPRQAARVLIGEEPGL